MRCLPPDFCIIRTTIQKNRTFVQFWLYTMRDYFFDFEETMDMQATNSTAGITLFERYSTCFGRGSTEA